MRSGLRLICTIAYLISGCALTTDNITLVYEPQPNVTRLVGANDAKVAVDMFDLRKMKDRVSVKKNGYGMEMAPIVADNSVTALITKAIETELVNRGFVLGAGAARLVVELQNFYNDFKSGFWSGMAEAQVVMNTQVKNSSGNILFSKLVVGNGNYPGVQLASGENAKVSLEQALSDAISNLFADSSLLTAIMQAARSP